MLFIGSSLSDRAGDACQGTRPVDVGGSGHFAPAGRIAPAGSFISLRYLSDSRWRCRALSGKGIDGDHAVNKKPQQGSAWDQAPAVCNQIRENDEPTVCPRPHQVVEPPPGNPVLSAGTSHGDEPVEHQVGVHVHFLLVAESVAASWSPPAGWDPEVRPDGFLHPAFLLLACGVVGQVEGVSGPAGHASGGFNVCRRLVCGVASPLSRSRDDVRPGSVVIPPECYRRSPAVPRGNATRRLGMKQADRRG